MRVRSAVLLRLVGLRPRMYLPDDTYACHVAFACGLDAGTGFTTLHGFQEFVAERIGQPETPTGWPLLILWLLEPIGPKDTAIPDLSDAESARATALMHELLNEFYETHAEHAQDPKPSPNDQPTSG